MARSWSRPLKTEGGSGLERGAVLRWSTALIGELYKPFDGNFPGTAWVFIRSGSTWSQQGPQLFASAEPSQFGFGSSVALSSDGNTALVGGPGDNNNDGTVHGVGAAWVFINTVKGHSVTVAKDGSGAGSVTSSPAGIDCGPTCEHSYGNGTWVTLTATPAAGSTFAGWSGAGCSGTGSCQVTMSFDQIVTAIFNTTLPGNAALPSSVTRPTITGTVTQGRLVSESHGSWTNTPTSYRYRWQDCDRSGNGCSAIAGATAQTYLLSASDVGHTIRVQGTAANADGAGTPASSAPTHVVQADSGMPMLAHVRVAGRTAWVSVICAGDGGVRCRVTLTLTATETVKRGTVIALRGAKHKSQKPRAKTVVLGWVTGTLSAGQRKTVKLALNKAGKRLLKARHALWVKLKLIQSGKTVSGRTLTFKSKNRRKHVQRAGVLDWAKSSRLPT